MAGTWTATRLMVSAPDGAQAQQITDGSSIAWNSHWSPDGRRIAFTGRMEVWVMNPDGSGRRQITRRGGRKRKARPWDGNDNLCFRGRSVCNKVRVGCL